MPRTNCYWCGRQPMSSNAYCDICNALFEYRTVQTMALETARVNCSPEIVEAITNTIETIQAQINANSKISVSK